MQKANLCLPAAGGRQIGGAVTELLDGMQGDTTHTDHP